MTDSAADEVLAFWFGDTDAARPEWFRSDAAFDREIAARFGALVEAALRGDLDGWAADPQGALARIVLLDQFTRNAFRGTPRAFAGDAKALAAARQMVARGDDLTLSPRKRVFVYLPFEHAEDIDAQREALRLFSRLAAQDPASAGNVEWAQRHHDVIARFGRFPHRNAILGRASTPEEEVFLEQPGSRF